VDNIVKYLTIISTGYCFLGVFFINAAAFNAIKKPLHSTLSSILRLFGIYIPLAYVFSLFFKLEGIFIGATLSSIIAGVLTYLWLKLEINKLVKTNYFKQ